MSAGAPGEGAARTAPEARAIRTAAILSTGEELLRGAVADSNTAWVARRLRSLGFELGEARIVGDGIEAIGIAVADLAARFELVIVTGGLGPTDDDRTREALAAAAGAPLRSDPDAERMIAEFFARLGRSPSPSNARQARLPEGARPLRNELGSAPGLELRIGAALVVALPGVPHEMRAMLEDAVVPRVGPGAGGAPVLDRALLVCGLPESVVGERIADLLAAGARPRVGITVALGLVTVTLTDRADEPGRRGIEACVAELRARLGSHVVSDGGETLPQVVVSRLRERGESVACAESCTGGMISAAITSVPGASDVFLEARVTYADDSKVRALGIGPELLRAHGAVSEPVARAMAQGVRVLARTTWGIAATGIAGPGGGTAEKPVGLVHLAVAGPASVAHVRRVFPGDRDSIRRFATTAALDLLRRQILVDLPPSAPR